MKLESNHSPVVSSQEFQSQDFTIGDPSFVINLLSSKLYSNPIQSAIREIASNAEDANVEANRQDIPIRIKLPSLANSTFYVEDDGSGISPENVVNFYTKMGVSSKRNSNSVRGMFGLGKIASLATGIDAFTVKTTTLDHIYEQDGKLYENALVTREYVVTKSESITLHKTWEGLERDRKTTGTRISWDVNSKNFQSYRSEVQCLSHFRVLPVIVDQPDFVWNTVEKIYEGKGFFVGKNSTGKILLSKIAYPYDLNLIEQKINPVYYGAPVSPDKAPPSFYENLYLSFDQGEIPVSPSRELIEWNDKSLNLIVEAADKAYTQFKTNILKDIQKAPDFWSAYWLLNDVKSLYYIQFSGTKWEGKYLETPSDLKNYSYSCYTGDEDSVNRTVQHQPAFPKNSSIYVFVFDDTGTNNVSVPRIKRIFKDNPSLKKVYVARPHCLSDYPDRYPVFGPQPLCLTADEKNGKLIADKVSELKKLVDHHHLTCQTSYLSDYKPYVVRQPSSGGSDAVYIKSLDYSGATTYPSVRSDSIDLENDKGIYVVSYYGNYYLDKEKSKQVTRDQLDTIGMNIKKKIYIISATKVTKIGDQLTSLEDVLKTEVAKSPAIKHKKTYKAIRNQYDFQEIKRIFSRMSAYQELLPDTFYVRLAMSIAKNIDNYQYGNHWTTAVESILGEERKENVNIKTKNRLNQFLSKFKNKNELLSILYDYRLNTNESVKRALRQALATL